jgi:hypothetical protein
MAITIVFGTTAELIKLYPIIAGLKGDEYSLVCTMQQGKSLEDALCRYGLIEE